MKTYIAFNHQQFEMPYSYACALYEILRRAGKDVALVCGDTLVRRSWGACYAWGGQ